MAVSSENPVVVVTANSTIAAPVQTGHAGEYLRTDGTSLAWEPVDALPVQTGQAGKYLTTDGTNAEWASLASERSTVGTSIYLYPQGTNEMDAGAVTITNRGVFAFALDHYEPPDTYAGLICVSTHYWPDAPEIGYGWANFHDNYSASGATREITSDANGDVLVTGKDDIAYDAFVAKYQAFGQPLWFTTFSHATYEVTTRGVVASPSGNVTVLLTVYNGTSDTLEVVVLDPQGSLLSHGTFPAGYYTGKAIESQTEAARFVVANNTDVTTEIVEVLATGEVVMLAAVEGFVDIDSNTMDCNGVVWNRVGDDYTFDIAGAGALYVFEAQFVRTGWTKDYVEFVPAAEGGIWLLIGWDHDTSTDYQYTIARFDVANAEPNSMRESYTISVADPNNNLIAASASDWNNARIYQRKAGEFTFTVQYNLGEQITFTFPTGLPSAWSVPIGNLVGAAVTVTPNTFVTTAGSAAPATNVIRRTKALTMGASALTVTRNLPTLTGSTYRLNDVTVNKLASIAGGLV